MPIMYLGIMREHDKICVATECHSKLVHGVDELVAPDPHHPRLLHQLKSADFNHIANGQLW